MRGTFESSRFFRVCGCSRLQFACHRSLGGQQIQDSAFYCGSMVFHSGATCAPDAPALTIAATVLSLSISLLLSYNRNSVCHITTGTSTSPDLAESKDSYTPTPPRFSVNEPAIIACRQVDTFPHPTLHSPSDSESTSTTASISTTKSV